MTRNPYHNEVVRLYQIMKSGRAYLNTSEADEDFDLDLEIMEDMVSANVHSMLSIFHRNSEFVPYKEAADFSNWLEANMRLYVGVVRKDLDVSKLVLVRE